MAKRRNPADSTLRNDRASLARDKALSVRIKAVQAQVNQLREQLAALFEAKRKQDARSASWTEPYPSRKKPFDTVTKYRVQEDQSRRDRDR